MKDRFGQTISPEHPTMFRAMPVSVKRRCLALKKISIDHEILEVKFREERSIIRSNYSYREPASNFGDCLLPVAAEARELEALALSYLLEADTDQMGGMSFNGLRERLKKCEEKCHQVLTHLANIDWRLNEYDEALTGYNSALEANMAEYNKELNELYRRRKLIVEGDHEPDMMECNLPVYTRAVLDKGEEYLQAEPLYGEPQLHDEEVRGVPDFWFQSLTSALSRLQIIHPHDIDPLRYLSDVRYYYDTERDLPVINSDKRCQLLLFFFQENPHFSNRILSKSLHIDRSQQQGRLMFDGVCVTGKEGCAINWFCNKVSADESGDKENQQLANNGQVSAQLNNGQPEEEDGMDLEMAGETATAQKALSSPSFFDFFTDAGLEPSRSVKRCHNGLMVEVELDYEVFVRLRDFIAPHAVVTYSRGALAGFGRNQLGFPIVGNFGQQPT